MSNELLQIAQQRFEEFVSTGDTNSDKLTVYNTVAKEFCQTKPALTIEFAEIIKEEAINQNDTIALALAFYASGVSHFMLSKVDVSLAEIKKSIELLEKTNKYDEIGSNYNMLGIISRQKGNFADALVNWQSSSSYYQRAENKIGEGAVLNNLGALQTQLGNFTEALDSYQKSVKIFQEFENLPRLAMTLSNIGIIYENLEKYDQALEYFKQSIPLQESTNDQRGLAMTYHNIAGVLKFKGEYAESKEMAKKSLAIREELQDLLGITTTQGLLCALYREINEEEKSIDFGMKSIENAKKIGDKFRETASLIELARTYEKYKNFNSSLELLNNAVTIATDLQAKELLFKIHKDRAVVLKHLENYKSALESFESYFTLEKEVFNEKSNEKMQQLQVTFEVEKKEREAEIYRLRNVELQSANDEILRQQDILEKQAAEIELANTELNEKNILIEEAHSLSESLLLNVLPPAIAARLKANENPIADRFENVTVLFADIAGFTHLSSSISPETIVGMLNNIFTEFDAIADKYGLEKIKTIGDNYMCVGGLPEVMENNTEAVARFALEIREIIKNFDSGYGIDINARIGFHTGPVVAGVIGKRKFAYDLWGDTVNTASRMESHGEVGKIHVTEKVYTILQDLFTFEFRGPLTIKGKGTMNTYFLLDAK
ncbi:MAG: tetratricopeptide repeat protein [Candidatus Kapabacteria bacterium]|nr:tetratricopeptide repeat protein [Candidatus Kapabacteria bacterium]